MTWGDFGCIGKQRKRGRKRKKVREIYICIYIYIYSLGEGPQFGERCPKWLHVRPILRSFFVQFWSVWDQFLVFLGSWRSILGSLGVCCDSASDYEGQRVESSDSGGSQMGSKMRPKIKKMRQKTERRR